MVIAMMMPTMLNVYLMEEIAVDHVSIQTIAPIALALAISMRIECPMPLLEMVIAMMK
jgi:hypothetical protein